MIQTDQALVNRYVAFLSAEQGSDSFSQETPGRPHQPDSARLLSEDELLAVEINVLSTIRTNHTNLWSNRGTETEGLPSQSEADFKLLLLIGRELLREGVPIDQVGEVSTLIFNRSELAKRDKWQKRKDYRQRTVRNVLKTLKEEQAAKEYDGEDANAANPKHLRDLKHARLFAIRYKGQFCFVHKQRQWLCWDGIVWVPAERGEAIEAAKGLAIELLATAIEANAKRLAGAKQAVADAKHAHTERGIMAMLNLASSEPELAISIHDLDAHPMLLGVRNGVVDLESGALLAPDPEMFITKRCAAHWVSDPVCPNWQKFLLDVFDHDEETIRSVQILLGKTLIGEVRDEIMVICYGNGANGKSVFSNVIHEVLGDYAHTAPPSLLNERRNGDNAPRSDIAALKGMRYVSVNELQSGDRLDEQVVKLLAGREPMSARHLYQEFITFKPTFCVWVRTNHKPNISGDDPATWRRIVLIAFSRTFSKEEQNPLLQKTLFEERDGILCWAVEGARLYLREGLLLSPRMLSDIAVYRTESDLVGEFLTERTLKDPNGRVERRILYSNYSFWCKEGGTRALSKKSLTQRLGERGYGVAHSGATTYYTGLQVLPTPEQREPFS